MISRLQYLQNKIVDHETALKRVNMWKMKSNKTVFTNGCFDILHEGHITYLAEAAELGDKLIIGLNTDASVKRLEKGDDRPLNSEASRAVVLASLGYVDMVVLFDEDTPEKIIRMLNPDILVKGADYNPDETNKLSKEYIVGSDYIKEQGGQIVAIPLVDGFSTTAIINKLRG